MIPTAVADVGPRCAMTELSLSVELRPGSENGLLRALTVLHRRRCRVLEARYGSAGDANRLALRVEAPPRHAHCLERWLSSLVDVRAVVAGPSLPAELGQVSAGYEHQNTGCSR
jgi:acetolactate synthase regulatory subunit